MVREIAFFAGVALLLVALWAIKDEKVSKKIKAVVTALVLFGGFGAWFYESEINKSEEKNAQLLQEFRQGRALKCGDTLVTNEKFNYEFGTACFVAKREIKELASVIIPIKTCEKADEIK